jgi:hypothetical protein
MAKLISLTSLSIKYQEKDFWYSISNKYFWLPALGNHEYLRIFKYKNKWRNKYGSKL